MSTRPPTRTLFTRWIDDAAVFPPGNAPLARAWDEHLALRAGGYADLLGPLLVGAPGAAELAGVAEAAVPPELLPPVAVTPVARAGVPVDDLFDAVQILRSRPHLHVASAEVAHAGDGAWRRLLQEDLLVVVEVPREGEDLARALDDLAGAGADGRVVAKLRTQATPGALAPTPRQLAEFLLAVRERDLPFKLTGGLHGAVRHGEGETAEHGCLNVLVAAHHLRGKVDLPTLTATLEITDGEALAGLVSGLDEEAAVELRSRFVSFGCCGVLDPIGDLVDLGLLPAAEETTA